MSMLNMLDYLLLLPSSLLQQALILLVGQALLLGARDPDVNATELWSLVQEMCPESSRHYLSVEDISAPTVRKAKEAPAGRAGLGSSLFSHCPALGLSFPWV